MGDDGKARADARKRVLGWGIACAEIMPGVDIARDLRVVADADGRIDFARVEGIANLGQDLTIALSTALGSDPFDTTFGFDGLRALVEETHPVMQRERVRLAVMAVLRRDARVRRIIDIELGQSGGARTRALGVDVRFEAQSGDELTLALGGVATGA